MDIGNEMMVVDDWVGDDVWMEERKKKARN